MQHHDLCCPLSNLVALSLATFRTSLGQEIVANANSDHEAVAQKHEQYKFETGGFFGSQQKCVQMSKEIMD